MNQRKKYILLPLLAIIVCGITDKVYADKVAIEIISSSKDTVGQRFIYQIKEYIRRSASLRITTKDEPRLTATIVTIDPWADSNIGYKNLSTVYSATLRISGAGIGDYYITQWVGICGKNRVKEFAGDIVAEIDGYSQRVEESKDLGNKFKEFLQMKEKAKENLQAEVDVLKQQVDDLNVELKNEKAKSWWQKLTGK